MSAFILQWFGSVITIKNKVNKEKHFVAKMETLAPGLGRLTLKEKFIMLIRQYGK